MSKKKVIIKSTKPSGVAVVPIPVSPMDILPPPKKFTKWKVN